MEGLVNRTVDIIMPTYDQDQGMLEACIRSMLVTGDINPIRILVVNNGKNKITINHKAVEVIDHGEGNIGWERGLVKGLEKSDSENVIFANDDLYVPDCARWWVHRMAATLNDKTIGGAGPVSNCVMGPQHVFALTGKSQIDVKFLIGFCVMYKRSVLDAVGSVPVGLPGGDDLDLGIRVRKAGYRLVCCRDIFIWHHGFQTGIRVHGDHTKPGGWNSKEMTAATHAALIEKHGKEAVDELWGAAQVGPA